MKPYLTILLTIVCLKSVFLLGWSRNAEARGESLTRFAAGYFDAAYYDDIGRRGYGSPQGASAQRAFLPFYPMTLAVLRGVSNTTGISHELLALGANFLFSVAGGVLLFAYLRRRYSHRIAELAVVLLFLSPAAVFFDVLYPEALLLFVIGLVLLFCLKSGSSKSRMTLGTIAGLCHPQGIAISLLSPSWSRQGKSREDALWLAPLAAVILFAAYIALRSDNLWAFLEAQKEWGRFRLDGGPGLTWLDACFLGATLTAALCGARYLHANDRWYFFGLAALPLLTGSLASYGRFCAVSYPLALVAAFGLARLDRRRWMVSAFVLLSIGRILVQRQMLEGRFLG